MNKKLLPILFLFCLLSVGCVSPYTQFPHDQTGGMNTTSPMLEITDEKLSGGYSVNPPDGWTVRDFPGSPYKGLYGPRVDNFTPNISIREEYYNGPMDQYIRRIFVQLEKVMKAKKVSQSPFFTQYYLGVKLITFTEKKNLKFTQTFYFFENTVGKKVVVTAKAPRDSGSQYDPVFDGIMQTFKMDAYNIVAKKDVKPSIKKAGSGTCFVISSDGQLVTSYHVVEGSDNIKVRLEDGQVEEAKLLKSSPTNDLAILQIQRKTPNFLPLVSAKTVSLGTPVFTMGFPAISVLGSDVKFSEGVINSLSGFQNDATYMQISMPVHPGNSGGPIVTDDGTVVGIVTATAAIATFIKQTGTLPQNVNWGVKADYLIPMIDKLETPNIKAKNRQEAIELVRKALCFITVE